MLNRLLTLFSLIFLLFHVQATTETTIVVPNTYVIEFDRPINSFVSKRHILSKRSIFYEQLRVYNISYDIRHEYDIINAVSIEFKTPRDSALFFEKALGVKRAWPVVRNCSRTEIF
jgi:minor extracellular serine protease Vpr